MAYNYGSYNTATTSDLLGPAPDAPPAATSTDSALASSEPSGVSTEAPPAPHPGPSINPKRNNLSFAERHKLYVFLDAEAVRQRLPHEPDRVFAEEATAALGFPVTTPNVTNLRVDMKIAKVKPEPPAPPPAPVDMSLAEIQQRLLVLEQRGQVSPSAAASLHDPIQAATTAEVIRKLQERVEHLEYLVTSNALRHTLIVPAGSPLHPSNTPAAAPNTADTAKAA